MKIVKINKNNKTTVHKFTNKEWLKFNKEKSYIFEDKNYSFALFDKKSVIGYIKFSINGGAGYLKQLIILKESRKQGAGKVLMKKFESFLKKKKCHVAYLETSEKHKEALRFYKKGGYRRVATLKRNKCNFDWYILEKRLI